MLAPHDHLQGLDVSVAFERDSGFQCFYSCSTLLVGGNGTVWASNKTGYTYFRIDTASTLGYITAA